LSKGSALAYVAKCVSKSIDGEGVARDNETSEMGDHTARRIVAWARGYANDRGHRCRIPMRHPFAGGQPILPSSLNCSFGSNQARCTAGFWPESSGPHARLSHGTGAGEQFLHTK